MIDLEESSYLDGGDEPSDEELETVLEFAVAGGGIIISSECSILDGGSLTPSDTDSVNRSLQGLEIEAQAVSHDWGDVGASIDVPCVPPVG